jgi:hypothetical protein
MVMLPPPELVLVVFVLVVVRGPGEASDPGLMMQAHGLPVVHRLLLSQPQFQPPAVPVTVLPVQ